MLDHYCQDVDVGKVTKKIQKEYRYLYDTDPFCREVGAGLLRLDYLAQFLEVKNLQKAISNNRGALMTSNKKAVFGI